MLRLESEGFVMFLGMLRCSSLVANADDYLSEIGSFFQVGAWRLSSSLVESVAVHAGPAAGEQLAEPAAFGILQRKPNTSHVRSQ